LFELEKNEEVNRLIAVTKSDSGISGPELVQAHINLGQLLGKEMSWFTPEDTTVVAILRGGVFFAMGLYLQMGCKFQMYDPKNGVFHRPDTKNVILADSVVNTGKTIKPILDPDMYIACCVINERALPQFERQLFTIRVSKNAFVGANVARQKEHVGPDTTMRLFNLI
jgi:hypothetical protein